MRLILSVLTASLALAQLPFPGPGRASTASPSLTWVQVKGAKANSTGVTVAFGSTPTSGAILACGISGEIAKDIVLPAGWTEVAHDEAGGSTRLTIAYGIRGGEANSYLFEYPAAYSTFISAICHEVTGQNGTPIDGSAFDPQGASTTATPTDTPATIPTLALSWIAVLNNNTLSSVSMGWTDAGGENQTQSFYSTYSARRDALTTDTSTAISNTFTISGSTTVVGGILLIK